ncbi:MAG: hypothetical protein WCT15_05505 [Candidatus Omnitrophota bacterium]
MKTISLIVLIMMLATFQSAFCEGEFLDDVTFTVLVEDEKGDIIPNVGIEVKGAARGGGIAPQGKFIFEDYPQGDYDVMVKAKDYHGKKVSIDVEPGMKPVKVVLSKKDVSAEQVESKVDFAVLIVDEKGAPVDGANIEISGPVSGGGVAPHGQADFKGFPEGSYEIKVSAKDHISEAMVLKVSKDMGSEIGGLTGVTILLGKKKPEKTVFQPEDGVRRAQEHKTQDASAQETGVGSGEK